MNCENNVVKIGGQHVVLIRQYDGIQSTSNNIEQTTSVKIEKTISYNDLDEAQQQPMKNEKMKKTKSHLFEYGVLGGAAAAFVGLYFYSNKGGGNG